MQTPTTPQARKPKLLDEVRIELRSRHYSRRTEGYDIRTIQELLGHKSVKTTMIYRYVLNRGLGIISPLD